MWRRLLVSARLNGGSARRFCSGKESGGSGDGNEGKSKNPSVKDVLKENILKAVDDLVAETHPDDKQAKKDAKKTLFAKLISLEKETYEAASKAPMNDMLMDEGFNNLIADYAEQAKREKTTFKRIKTKDERMALSNLRQEIFSKSLQSGMSPTEARQKSESVVERAQMKFQAKKMELNEETRKEIEKLEKEEEQMSVRERKLLDMALAKIESIYEDASGQAGSYLSRPILEPDPKSPPLFSSKNRLGFWKTLADTKEHSLQFWNEWDMRAANATNLSFGPENAFEEQIEWTKKGKQWPYPIDNEYMMGSEADVPFTEHIMLERHLPELGIPKDGPIATFMHLVCVGLSKNPYMTIEKKLEHLIWFGEYFNKEKQELIKKLHEQEQSIAQSA
ncbi:hypothetical protein WR25_04410 [Diploscapter pachys]|uniref:Small ribosomal subunit protein mS31 n=1 Tax=Diploscapter pachys TaxID=2018661 RepID=A0A2A2J8I9_9BILA|nr:hypothetical protein WR25_04410 [Diploscapter pachys]